MVVHLNQNINFEYKLYLHFFFLKMHFLLHIIFDDSSVNLGR